MQPACLASHILARSRTHSNTNARVHPTTRTPIPPNFCCCVQVFIRDCSVVSPFALVLFGGPLLVRHGRSPKVLVGEQGWVEFRAESRVGVLAKGLRAGITQLLAAKVENPHLDLSDSPVVTAIHRLLNGNGY